MLPRISPRTAGRLDTVLMRADRTEFITHFELCKLVDPVLSSMFAGLTPNHPDPKNQAVYRAAAMTCWVISEQLKEDAHKSSPFTEDMCFPHISDDAINESLLCVDISNEMKRQKFVAQLERHNPSLHRFVDSLLSVALKHLERGDMTISDAIYRPMLHLIHTLAHSYAEWREVQGG